jgi:hypothetical protein
MAKTVEEIADAMYKMVEEATGLKKLKPMDLTKAMLQLYGDEVDKKMCKAAIRQLVDSGRCVYTYFGGSFLELPRDEGAANE